MDASRPRAPVSYDDWRDIYQRQLKVMGLVAHSYWRLKHLNAPDVIFLGSVRRVWQMVHRLNRVKQQLHECHERMDVTLLQAIADFASPDGD
jgi:hypothetical protein